MRRPPGIGLLLASRLCFGLAVFVWAALGGGPLAATSLLAGALTYLALTLVRGRQGVTDLAKVFADRRSFLSGALLGPAIVCGSASLHYLPVTSFAALGQLTAVWAALLAPLFGERLNRLDAWALPLAVGGGLVLVGGGGRLTVVGVALVLANTLLISLMVHVNGRVGREARHRPEAWVAIVYLSAALLTLPLQGSWQLGGLEFCGAIVAGVLVASGDRLVFSAMRVVSVARSVLLKPASSFISALLGVVFLSAPLTLGIVVGGAMIIAAGLLVDYNQRRDPLLSVQPQDQDE